jgi:hypothetical protein
VLALGLAAACALAFLLRHLVRTPARRPAGSLADVQPPAAPGPSPHQRPPAGLRPPPRVRIAPPASLSPHPAVPGGYVYWDGSAEAEAAAAALHRLPDGLQQLFRAAVESAAMTVRLGDDGDLRLLAPECFDPAELAAPCHAVGLYLPGKCILVAVTCEGKPAQYEVAEAANTAVHEAFHAIDDYLGLPAGVHDDYMSDDPHYRALIRDLPREVFESFRSWGYPPEVIPREIFAEGGAAYLRHRGDPVAQRRLAIGQTLTRYATAPSDAAVEEVGRRMDDYYRSLERSFAVTAS